MKQLILFLLTIGLCSCDMILRNAPTDPGEPKTPIVKSVPFTCEGGEYYVKMDDGKVINTIGPYLITNNKIYSFASKKLTIIDCNQFKILNSYNIGTSKIYSIYEVYPSKNGRFWMLYSNYLPNTTYEGSEVVSLVDSTGNIIKTLNFSNYIKINTTKSGGCLLRLSYGGYSTLYNYDENGTLIWQKGFTVEYDLLHNITSDFYNTLELSTGEFLYTTFIEDESKSLPLYTTRLTKLSKDGNIISYKSITGYPRFEKIIQQSDTSYLLFNGSYVMKFDSTLTYVKEIKSDGYMYYDLIKTHDGSIMACYNVNSNGGDLALSKLRDDLTPEWTQTYGGTGSETRICFNELASGGFLILGYSINLTGKWVRHLRTETGSPYLQHYVYWEETVCSNYIIKTDNLGITCK